MPTEAPRVRPFGPVRNEFVALTFRSAPNTFSLHEVTNRDLAPREVFPVHQSPSGSSLLVRLQDALYRLRLPRPSLIVPVVLVCGVLAGIALVLPSYAPAVTGTHGALGLESTDAASAAALGTGTGTGSSTGAGRSTHAEAAAPSSTVAPPPPPPPAPAPVVETPTTAPDETTTAPE